MPDDDDDNDNTGEGRKIISFAKESTMPTRYCIHTVLIRVTGVKPRWTKSARDQSKKKRERKRERHKEQAATEKRRDQAHFEGTSKENLRSLACPFVSPVLQLIEADWAFYGGVKT